MAFAEYPVVSSSGSGGITKVADSIERNALTPADGDIVIQLDNDFLYEWNGSSWAVLADRTWQTAGSILGAKTFDTASRWSVATNQQVFGVTNTTTVNYAAPSANRVYTVPDVGADAAYVMTAGNQTIGGTKTFSSTISGSISGNAGTVTNGAYVNVGNVFTLAQSITASSNQLVLYSGVNQLTLNSGTSAAARTYTVPDTGTTDTFAMLGGSQTFSGAKTFSSTITATNSSAPLTLNVGSSSNAELLFTSSATQPDLYINFRSTGTGPQSWLLGLNPSGISSNAFGLWDNTAGAPIFTTEQTTNVTTYYANVTINNASNQLSLSSSVNLLNLNSGTSAAARTYTFPDVGTTGTFAMLQGSQTFAGAKTFSSAVTISAASNQLVLSSGVNQLTLNSSTSAAARTYAFPDVGTSGTVAMLEGAQTFSALKTFSSGLAISGGSAANNTIWVASNTLNIRGGTSGTDIYNTSGNVVLDITDAGVMSVGQSSSTATNLVVNGSVSLAQSGTAFSATTNFPYMGSKNSNLMFNNGNNGTFLYHGLFYDGTDKHAVANRAAAGLSISSGGASSDFALNLRSSQSYSHAADSTATLVSLVNCTHAGAWTWGPTGFSGFHTVNGGMRLPSSGATASTLNFYAESSISTTYTWNSSGPTSAAVTVYITRIGNIVTLTQYAGADTASSASSSTLATSNTVLPSWARPTVSIVPRNIIYVVANAATDPSPGSVQITTAGNIEIRRRSDSSVAWGGANNGTGGFTISYYV